MASSSQHRCVFVGNIPYDATEEQLIDICREVGPVVSFRLVIDRETGKPKGYGFCEYKDEETALSARRNLQGYEINGRQLRVDFAENDKNADRNREQGRGGPGLVANANPQKQIGGPAVPGESAQHPIGLHIAITAATVMAGALGGPQIASQSNQTGLQGQSALASDPLTLHLAKMSRAQLNEIMSELKVMALQNRDAAHQLLLARPQLSKALFQAQIMLGLVTPQVLQMPNIRQPSSQSAVSLPQDARQGQQPAVQNVPMFAPLAPQGQLPVLPQNTLSQNQLSVASQPPLQPQTLVSRYTSNLPPQQVAFPGQSGVPPLPPLHPSIRPQIQVVNSLSSNQQMQPSLLQHVPQLGTSSLGRSSQIVLPNASVKSSLLPHLSMSDSASQTAPQLSSGIPDAVSKVVDRSAQRSNAYLNVHRSSIDDTREPSNPPTKLLKLDGGRSSSFPGSSDASNASRPSKAFVVNSMPTNPLPQPEESPYLEKRSSQLQLPSDVESALLQQVLSLTPEQLSSLPPDQQQQVIQLQQALQRDQLHPS